MCFGFSRVKILVVWGMGSLENIMVVILIVLVWVSLVSRCVDSVVIWFQGLFVLFSVVICRNWFEVLGDRCLFRRFSVLLMLFGKLRFMVFSLL